MNLPPRRRDAHKGDAGHVLVVAGSRGMMGAARLCALGALRSGAGLVTLAAPRGEYAALQAPWECLTLALPGRNGALVPAAVAVVERFVRTRGVTAVAVGPGLSQAPGAARAAVGLIERVALPVVADADALNALSRPPRRRAPWVITPHPGEAARLLGRTVDAVQADRRRAASDLARRFGAVAVLKGAGTIVTDGRRSSVETAGNPGMASGGMGDVLTGALAALIAQTGAASQEESCFRAAALAVRAHARAGDRAARDIGPVGFLASDVAARLPAALKGLIR